MKNGQGWEEEAGRKGVESRRGGVDSTRRFGRETEEPVLGGTDD